MQSTHRRFEVRCKKMRMRCEVAPIFNRASHVKFDIEALSGRYTFRLCQRSYQSCILQLQNINYHFFRFSF